MSDLLKIKSHFDQLSGKLGSFSYRHEFTMNSVRLKIVLNILSGLPRGRVLDLGCGEAFTTCELLRAGWDAQGLELSHELVEGAQKYLVKNGYESDRIAEGSATDLSAYDDNSFDVVTCLGVAYYISDQERLYKEVNRVLRRGGIFICSHQNEMFSLFTFNKYTVQFFEKYIFNDEEDNPQLINKLKLLIANPEEPRKHEDGSSRDELVMYPENPLTIAEKIGKYGFELSQPIIYHGWHKLPPLLMGEAEKKASEKEDINHTTDWRSLFMAAHFLFISKRL